MEIVEWWQGLSLLTKIALGYLAFALVSAAYITIEAYKAPIDPPWGE